MISVGEDCTWHLCVPLEFVLDQQAETLLAGVMGPLILAWIVVRLVRRKSARQQEDI